MGTKKRALIFQPMSRVGSTFLQTILSAHPDVCITNETRLYRPRNWVGYFHAARGKIERYPIGKEKGYRALEEAYWKVEAEGMFADVTRQHRSPKAADRCLRAIEEALLGEYSVVGDKGYAPSLLRGKFMKGLVGLSPTVILFIYRDPRDICTSIARHKKADYPYNTLWAEDHRRHSLRWAEQMKIWEGIKERGRIPFYEVKYEELMMEYRRVLRGLHKILDVPAKPLIDAYHRRVAKRNHLGYWKKRHPDMEGKLHPDVFPVMERWGYRVKKGR